MRILKKIFDVLVFLSPKKIKKKLKMFRLGYSLITNKGSYLVSTGFVNSKLNQSLTDENNEYVPWMNYPIIDFLKERLGKNHEVFEYGSGSSTLFFAKRTKNITSIEYDKVWYDKVKVLSYGLKNIEILFFKVNELYPLVIENQKKKYDIIVIDGRKRVKCAKTAYNHLSKEGIVILDDSQREYYKDIFTFYLGKGFSQLTFKGLRPTGFILEQSTIFYRKLNNCLNI